MTKRKRGNFLIIFDGISIWPFLSLILVPLLNLSTKNDFDSSDFTVIIVFWLGTIAKAFNYISTYYTVDNKHILIESGLFNKKRVEIPLDTITTIDLSQNILHKFFNLYKVKLDNGSQSGESAKKEEFKMVLTENEALFLKKLISEKTDTSEISSSIESDIDSLRVSAFPKDFITLGLTKSKLLYFTTICPIIIALETKLLTKSNNIEEIFENFLSNQATLTIFITLFVLFLTIYIPSFVLSIASSVLTYYNFQASSTHKTIDIEYGLLVNKKYSLPKSKITAVILKQNLIMQIFRLYSVDVCAIGYGDQKEGNTEEQAILYPIANMQKATHVINTLLPEFEISSDIEHSPRRALRYFILRPFPFLLLIIAACGLYFTNFILAGISLGILAICLASALIQYKNCGIGINSSTITIRQGGFIRQTILVKTNSIESISEHTNYFKRRNRISSLTVNFLAPLKTASINVKNVDISAFKELERKLLF